MSWSGNTGALLEPGSRRTLLAESSWAVLSSPSPSVYMALARSLLPTSPVMGVYMLSAAPVMGLLPLYHCQVTVFSAATSGSSRVAMISTETWGCNVDRVTVPGSSTLVTSMVTCSVAGVAPPSDASTVTVYIWSVLSS